MKHCKKCHYTMTIRWAEKHPIGRLEMQRRNRAVYRERHPDRVKEQRQKMEILYGDRYRERRRLKYRELKNEVITKYGGKCICCKELNMGFLSLDHKNDDGATHRRVVPSSIILRWAKENNYPDTLQVMCYNCNIGRYMNNRYSKEYVCPHKI